MGARAGREEETLKPLGTHLSIDNCRGKNKTPTPTFSNKERCRTRP